MNRKLVSKSNYVLRKVLNNKENLDIIQDIIETFLQIKIKRIKLNPYLKSKEKYLPEEENFGIADVRILTEERKELNIGIQFVDGYYIQNKMLLYYAQIHTNQLEHDENRKIVKTITINLLDFEYLKTKEYHKKILIKDNFENKKTSEILELHVIELPKLKKYDKQLSKEEAWVKYFKGENIQEIKSEFEKIEKLDFLIDKYWREEKME